MLDTSIDFGGSTSPSGEVVTVEFPVDRYPKTAAHIQKAIREGEAAVCTIDRNGAKQNRQESLRGIPTKKGYDRDEWPMAMCEEGGTGADIEYVTPSDNRGAGSWIGNTLEDYPDGTRVKFKFK
ncbi:NucA/NucB deoxyribonuclease domain-containing protein [Saccharibacillus sp. JS10]|uniref:NucA/NucB deoxyribonuclease domain-containing protein n=1 Tax=Saccharibacillus sp. JS10 TaxID=2950552 RepID=UPI00210D2F0F|nr:NucA/NucB deoxyribonuclease domain-containing protein [Saccharibacillus sp. JS10]MCQ4086074.1 NucA/NucB deoxyribonuclease domain-containing protein [Saccharibacillus sp. JS10]